MKLFVVFGMLILFIGSGLTLGVSHAQTPKEMPKPLPIPNFQILTKKVQCASTKDMMVWLKSAGETDFEFLGMQIPGPGFQIVTAITRNNINGTFTVLETSSTGKSCIVSLGNFDGTTKGEDEKL